MDRVTGLKAEAAEGLPTTSDQRHLAVHYHRLPGTRLNYRENDDAKHKELHRKRHRRLGHRAP